MGSASGGLSWGRPLELDDYHGELAPGCELADGPARLADLVEPEAGGRTLHWGRNYLFVGDLKLTDGGLEVVVKQFRNQGLKARRRRRRGASKAQRSWRAARALVEAGVPTPRPVLLLESKRTAGPSFYVTERLAGVFESRYLFRALKAGRHTELFPEVAPSLFFETLGRMLRRLHDAGIQHRDISIGNLLVRCPEPDSAPEIFLIDLNRARLGRRMSVLRRTRDLCRLPIFQDPYRDVFLHAYWPERSSGLGIRKRFFVLDQRAFLLRNWLKDAIRAPAHWVRDLLVQRRAYDHIPPADQGAGMRDQAVWDRLSDQPHQHATLAERAKIRLADAGAHGAAALAVAGAAPRIWHRYRRLHRSLYQRPVRWPGVGVAVRPLEDSPDQLISAITELGVQRILLRLHPWQEDHSAEEALARELHSRGYELAFALPQNRDLVRDPRRWSAAVEELAERFSPFGAHFQVGQAINRSKWGIWNYREYLSLAGAAAEILGRRPGVQLLGPAVIDFELHAVAAVLNMKAPGLEFDVVTSLLYVDRRGAPENRQLGFDTVDKVTLLKAVAETARNCEAAGRCWVTEVNWPLWEGPHSPAGRSVSVDEQTQASFLVRYFLLALGTGLLERAFWWQLVARGYGLIDPQDDGVLRPRPSYRAMAHLHRRLDGATFVGPLEPAPPVYLYRFITAADEELLVGWTNGPPARIELPQAVTAAFDRDGSPLELVGRAEVELSASPVYLYTG